MGYTQKVSFIYLILSFIQQMFPEHVPGSTHCSGNWRLKGEHVTSLLPSGGLHAHRGEGIEGKQANHL